MSNWRLLSKRTIVTALTEYQENNSHFDSVKAFRYVSSKYPFGERSNYPYQVWLKSVKQAKQLINKGYKVEELMLINWGNSTSILKGISPNVNQLSLFSDEN